MEIQVTKTIQYGTERIYVVDEQKAKALAMLTGTKTLTREHIAALKALGFVFVVLTDDTV